MKLKNGEMSELTCYYLFILGIRSLTGRGFITPNCFLSSFFNILQCSNLSQINFRLHTVFFCYKSNVALIVNQNRQGSVIIQLSPNLNSIGCPLGALTLQLSFYRQKNEKILKKNFFTKKCGRVSSFDINIDKIWNIQCR